MTPPESHGTGAEPSAESDECRVQFAAERPGVFLMTDSLETGGSERQFSALARSLDRGTFRVHLGCIQRKGPFLEGLGDVAEYPAGRKLVRRAVDQDRACSLPGS